MKRTLTLFALILLLSVSVKAQGPICNGTRYVSYGYDTTRIYDVQYGNSANPKTGNKQKLLMDVYQPKNDNVQLRPLIIIMHGGTFISGTKRDAGVKAIADSMCRKGFVTASIEYRLQWGGFALPLYPTDSVLAAAIRGTQDMRTAIRYFYKSAAADGNPFKIDTNNIFILGESAGAIAALDAIYLRSMTQFNELGDTNIVSRNDGLFGSGGTSSDNHLIYPVRVKAVFSISGALGRAGWISTGDVPVFSVHAVNDGTVAYKTAVPGALSSGLFAPAPRKIVLSGSFSVDSAARAKGVHSKLLTWPQGDHVPYQNLSNATQIGYMRDVIKFVTENAYDGLCQNFTAVAPNLSNAMLEVYPNPVNESFRLKVGGTLNADVLIMDIAGREVLRQNVPAGETVIARPNVPAGIYMLQVRQGNELMSRKLQLN
jgi:para-nitrobenzyl esterase